MALPQKKKSAEEIAKLREELGLNSLIGPAPAAIPKSDPPAVRNLAAPPPSPAAQGPLPPSPSSSATQEPVPPPAAKPVRSLKKSERFPPATRPGTAAARSAPSSTLPARRHSERDIQELRRRAAFAIQSPAIQLQALTAHPALIILGYVLALSGAVAGFAKQPFLVTAACSLSALCLCAFLFLKKKRSTHHAGFIAGLALLVIVFAALYHFPQLRHAT